MFDLDGTLIDTMPGFADLAAEIVERVHGMPFAEARRRYMETSGIPFAQQLEVVFPSHADNTAVSNEFEERKRGICDATPLDERTLTALRKLQAARLKVVVSSNSAQHYVDAFARREPVEFDLALGFDQTQGLAKGRPHVDRVLAHFQVTSDLIWYAGDSLKDGQLAADCGLAFFGRIGTFGAADFEGAFPGCATIDHIDALLPLLAARHAAGAAAV